MWANFNAVGAYDSERTPLFNSEDSVNWYVILDPNGKKPQALSGTPGLVLEQVVEDSTKVFRQLFSFNGLMYAVIGDDVWMFDTDLTATFLGTIGTSTGFVSIEVNNNNQII